MWSYPCTRFRYELDKTFAVRTQIPGIKLFQIVPTTTTSLRVRLKTVPGADPGCVLRAVRAGEPPEQSPGGKYRRIIPLA